MTKKTLKDPTQSDETSTDQAKAGEARLDLAATITDPEPELDQDADEVEAEEITPEAPVAAEPDVAAPPEPVAETGAPVAPPDAPVAPEEITPEDLAKLAAYIAEMLPFAREELLAELVRSDGLWIERTIEGTVMTMKGITASSSAMGAAGAHQAIENWSNAARRCVLELQAVSNA